MAKKDGSVSKADMVRDAIKKLGWAASVDSYHAYILDTYKADMSKAHISQTKSNERKRQGVRGPRRSGRRGRPPGSGKKQMAEAAAAGVGAASVADILAFVDTVREWESKLGAASIREVVKTVLKK